MLFLVQNIVFNDYDDTLVPSATTNPDPTSIKRPHGIFFWNVFQSSRGGDVQNLLGSDGTRKSKRATPMDGVASSIRLYS